MLFTDGLVEAMDPSQRMFGMERMVRVIARGPSDAVSMLDRVVREVQRHVADAAQFDDTTVVCIGLDEILIEAPADEVAAAKTSVDLPLPARESSTAKGRRLKSE
jgi:hypothetical protein